MRRLTFILAALAGLASASPASAFTVRAVEIAVLTGPDGRTPCRIVADLYKPDGATARDPVAAVLSTNGFGGSKADQAPLARAYAARGYGFLSYSGLGFGGSGCKITLDDPDSDGRAGSQLVSFLGGSKAAVDGTTVDWVLKDARGQDGVARADDPRVGITGGSYGGQNQFAIAAQDPRVDALNPIITWNDLDYALTGNTTDLRPGVSYATTPGVAKLDWPLLFFGVGQGRGLEALIRGETSQLGSCPNFAEAACGALVRVATTGFPDPATTAFLRHASVASYTDRITVPTLLSQGINDTLFNLNEAVATYEALRAQGTATKLIFRSAGHSGGAIAGETTPSRPEASYESRMSLEWFDFYLRGIGDPPALDFSFHRRWATRTGDAAPAVGVTPTYPAGTATPLFLSGADGLTPARAAVRDGGATFLAAIAPTSFGGAAIGEQESFDLPGTFAAFTTAPLESDRDVVGIPRVTFRLDAPVHAITEGLDPGGKLVLFARLDDVGPGGVTTPGRIVGAVRVPDVDLPVTVELPGIVHRFARGHRVRLVLAQGNLLRRGNTVPGPVTVRTTSADPGVLELPVLGEQVGATGGASGGRTAFAASPAAPVPQRPGLGALPKPGGAAARMPSARRCVSRRAFRIRLARAARSAVVTVNGKRVRVISGRRLRAPVDLRGLPRGTARVVVMIRTASGRTRRSARTYRTCVVRRSPRG